jgi:bifunctional enzyme Fae/Hps
MLRSKLHYLQVALNSNPRDARSIIQSIPVSERILLEAGTPLIKEYGSQIIRHINNWWSQKIQAANMAFLPYVVADLKCMDRGEREVHIAAQAGASAAVALGRAPTETLVSFIDNCEQNRLDSMIDMMNVDKPYQVLRLLPKSPKVVILHRGVDEERFSDKPLPIHMINKIKGAFDLMISIAGGDTPREVQSSVFNGADIVVLWKDFYQSSTNVAQICEHFLSTIK